MQDVLRSVVCTNLESTVITLGWLISDSMGSSKSDISADPWRYSNIAILLLFLSTVQHSGSLTAVLLMLL